jgi:hypothetical protein
MATKQQIIDYLTANPNLSDAQLVAYMAQNQISPAQLAEASGAPVGQISAQIGATIPPNQAVLLGDTWIQPQYQTYGVGESEVIGPLENVQVYKTTGGKNDQVAIGTDVQNFSPSGEYLNTFKTQKTESGFGEFLAGAGLLFGLPGLLNAGGGVAGAAGTAGMSAAELASYDMALGGLGGTAGGASLVGGATIPTISSLTGGSGLLTGQAAGITAESVAKKLADDAIAQGLLTNTGNTALNTLGTKTAAELAAEKLATDTAAKTAITAGTKTAAEIAAEELAKKTATSVLVNEVTKAINPNTVSGLLQTGGSLLQSKESKAAAEQAARDITTATQAGVAGSQFRPVGMTTRFGTSQYKYDPVTGQMISAGYQLTPEAKAQQDRFAKMANYSLTQAENAQSQFNPLQAGAANLFTLGNKYIEKTPESVAQTYIDQQMALLKPSREVELANLQNRLQQQGRLGLSVAQGGSMGATTPELQALYNARAQQEAVLAANAQQAGQQSVLFGAGLLGQGSQALGQYYGGQVAAYQPYQAAMGQVQNLESLGQQPLQMGATLGQQSATAGANAGRLGLAGAQIAGGFNTSANATFNPYAGLLTAAGSPSSMFGQSIAKYLSGGSVTPFDALSSTKYGDGLAGYEKMIQDIYGT